MRILRNSILKYQLTQTQYSLFVTTPQKVIFENDLLRFVPGSLQQTTRRLNTANGTGPPVQEGTIKINLSDDEGNTYLFLLEGCIYHKDSPINLLSTRQLAEKFLDADGNPDEENRIE